MSTSMPFERLYAPTIDELNLVFSDYTFSEMLQVRQISALYTGAKKGSNVSVHIKMFPRRLSKDKRFMNVFNTESEKTLNVKSTHFATLLEYGVKSEMPYLISRLSEGKLVNEFLDSGVLDSNSSAKVVHGVCVALSALHEEDVVHGDIRPENIYINANGAVTLSNPGIARLAVQAAGLQDNLGSNIGFHSPELRERSAISKSSDIYSVGALLCYLTTGYTPEVLESTGFKNKKLLQEVYPILLKSVRSDPRVRYQSVSEMRADLEKIIEASDLFDGSSRMSRYSLFRAKHKVYDISLNEKNHHPVNVSDESKKASESLLLINQRYQIRETISQREVGSIYRVFDTVLKSERLLTLFYKKKEVEWEDGFMTVISDMAKIQHPNIPTVLDAGIADMGPYIVQPIVQGELLYDVLRKHMITYDQAFELGFQLLDAMRVTYHYGFSNFAISPKSILVEDGGESFRRRYTITDTGYGRISNLLDPARLNDKTIDLCDSAVLPPELLTGMIEPQKSMVYAVGSIVYYALASGHPLSGLSRKELIDKYPTFELPDIRSLRPDIPVEFSDWLNKCIAVSIYDRFLNIDQALRSLPEVPMGAHVRVN